MNEHNIEDIISALYDMVQDARALPLGADKCILERDKVLDMLDEIIAQLPTELKQARTIVESRNELIGQARREAETILHQAQEQARQMVTNEAMTTINAGIRTLSGIKFLISEITKFDIISTAIVATPIPKPFIADVVVPKVGHIPNTNTKVGLFLRIPLSIICILFILTSFLSLLALCVCRSCARHAIS